MGEMILSRRNEAWLLQHGAIETGQRHYPVIIVLHVLFFASLIVEYSVKQTITFNVFLLIPFFILQAAKIWIVFSLGKFWNTKIYRIPDAPLIKRGPYRYFKHPNYMIVVIEIAVIPLMFQLVYTAIVFSILNAIVLTIRIYEENKVIAK
jgi:methyltransferase